MRTAIVLLALLLTCSCATVEEEAKEETAPPKPKWVSAESGRGVPYFSRYERLSAKPVPEQRPKLVERNNCLPAFHAYEKTYPVHRDPDIRR
jgi:hypothetical protein